MVKPRPLFVYYQSFRTNNTIFTKNQCEKCLVHPVYSAGTATKSLILTEKKIIELTNLGNVVHSASASPLHEVLCEVATRRCKKVRS